MAINSGRIDELVAAGRYSDAAKCAEEAGDFARAAALYERIWEFADASRCAERAGELARALRNAVEAADEARTEELAEKLAAGGEDGMREAADVLSERRQYARAAKLVEKLGDQERAIQLYTSAGAELDAARMLADAGRHREAGRLLERFIAQNDDSPDTARAHLQLGLVLASVMQHADAVSHLQAASRFPETRDAAQRTLILELAALGLRDAARDVLVSAREHAPDLPATVDEYLRAERDHQDHHQPKPDKYLIIGGRYRATELLGSGGSGRVYRAHDEVADREVAVKVFHTGSSRGTSAYERFVREARIASSMHHPNLVEVYSFSAELGFQVMELMSGSLRQQLSEKQRLSNARVRRLLIDLLAGLEFAHQRGVIHRDIKPANIFLDSSGSAKLGDFGVAHLLDLGQTQTGGLIGTLAYMSPEQITGANLSVAADFYAVGITAFECVTGELPFLGPDFVAQHLGHKPRIPSEVAGPGAAPWDELLGILMRKDPDERMESIEEIRRAINALDFGDEDAAPLLLPRAGDAEAAATPAPAPASQESVPEREERDSDAEPEVRYQFETPLAETEASQLSRAVDTRLDRSVIIERFREGYPTDLDERRLLSIARAGGPFLQRPLSYNRGERVFVYEAPAGQPLPELDTEEPLPPRRAIRLLKHLARGLRSLHRDGTAHGAIDASTVVIDDAENPTILVSGLPPRNQPATPGDDVSAVLNLVADALNCQPTPEELLGVVAADLSHPERVAILYASEKLDDGDRLFAFAEAVEIAVLKAELRAEQFGGTTRDRGPAH